MTKSEERELEEEWRQDDEGSISSQTIEDELAVLILLCELLRAAVRESELYKPECWEAGKRADEVSQKLRSLVSVATSTPSLYEQPVRRIVGEAVKHLDRALTIVRKCKRSSVLGRVLTITITSSTEFRKIIALLDASLSDLRWLLIARGVIQMGQLPDRVDAANSLSTLALDNDGYKKTIIEEAGVAPLLKLLKEAAFPGGQIAAAITLTHLATAPERARQIANEFAVTVIVQALYESPAAVQIEVAALVSRMAERDPLSQEEFVRENVIMLLVSILASDVLTDNLDFYARPQSIHSLVQINREMGLPRNADGSSRGREKERENGSPEMKMKLKVNCTEALWMLAKGSISNSRRITETKGLLCLAKLMEKETGDLRLNCLMTIMEICGAAESDPDLRSAGDVLNSLARSFSARETKVIRPLVNQLGKWYVDVATEATITLGKFVCDENFNRVEHSKAIIEFEGVTPLMRLLRAGEKALAVNVGNSEAMEQARALTVLELAVKSPTDEHPSLRELLPKAIYTLELYQASIHPHRQFYRR
ncbi:ARMADILLO BTB ARABIDOPSIS PROTEIN 1-like [Aristolochia californica]|uniref:ARMADILLO BTB ARABIDOPSIS PROTEIN 1-like n=1 Tax=Aristolochia californica TaxID=171875 RepID=UPI0035E3055E